MFSSCYTHLLTKLKTHKKRFSSTFLFENILSCIKLSNGQTDKVRHKSQKKEKKEKETCTMLFKYGTLTTKGLPLAKHTTVVLYPHHPSQGNKILVCVCSLCQHASVTYRLPQSLSSDLWYSC